MSILISLLSSYGKTPVWLAELTRGATVYRYHLGARDKTYEGETFAASALDFTELTYASDLRKDDFTLENFALSAADTQEIITAGRTPLTLRMIQGFEGSAEYVVPYLGTKTTLKFLGKSVSLVFSSRAYDLSLKSPGYVAQRQCPLRLYSADCGVVRASFEVAGTATAYASAVVTVAEAAGQANGYFTGGILTYGTEQRTIEKHAGAALTLSAGFTALEAEITAMATAAVTIAAGCDKSLTTCRDRFSNIAANAGMPAISDNPFIQTVF